MRSSVWIVKLSGGHDAIFSKQYYYYCQERERERERALYLYRAIDRTNYCKNRREEEEDTSVGGMHPTNTMALSSSFSFFLQRPQRPASTLELFPAAGRRDATTNNATFA
jgi:hypothetical protein